MYQKQRQTYDYHIQILSVTMKIRFPCKMKIEHSGTLLTNQISPNGKDHFVFNQEVILTEDPRNDYVELTIYLTTDIGSKYLAGTVRLYESNFVQSQEEIVQISLSKCMDSEAICQMKVNRIIPNNRHTFRIQQSKPIVKKSNSNFRSNGFEDIQRSPTMKNIHNAKHINTKTQYQFPAQQESRYSPEWGHDSPHQPIAKTVTSPRQSKLPNHNWGQHQQHLSLIDGEESSYKQAYLRLKQKHKHQSQQWQHQITKRIQFQNSQNALKLQLIRGKLRSDEQQRIISQKIKKNQELENELNKRNQQMRQLIDDRQNREIALEKLQRQLSDVNVRLQEITMEGNEKRRGDILMLKESQQRIFAIENQIEINQRELRYANQTINKLIKEKQRECNAKEMVIERSNRIVLELQNSLEINNNKHQQQIQQLRRQISQKNHEQSKRNEELQKELQITIKQKNKLQEQMSNFQNQVVKQGYEKEMINQQHQIMKMQCQSLKKQNERLTKVEYSTRVLKDEKQYLEKMLQSIKDYQNQSQTSMEKEYHMQIRGLQLQIKNYQERTVKLQERNAQIQKVLTEAKSEQESIKNKLSLMNNEVSEAIQREKDARRALQNKQKQFYSAETEHVTLRQKMKNIDQIYKLQADKLKAEIDKAQQHIKNQQKKCLDLQQKNKKIEMELGKMNVQMSYLQEQKRKDSLTLKQKHHQIQIIIKQYEEKVNYLERSFGNLRKSEKEAVFKAQSIEAQVLQQQQKIQKLKKQNKRFQQRVMTQQQTLSIKVSQLVEVSEQKSQISQRANILEHQLSLIRNNLQLANAQKSRHSKELQMTHQDYSKLKVQLQKAKLLLSQKQTNEDSMSLQLRSYISETNTYEMKVSLFKKEGQRFKEQVSQLIHKNEALMNKGEQRAVQNSKIEVDEFNFSQLFPTINLHFKEVRQLLLRQVDSISKLQSEKQGLKQQRVSLLKQKQQKQQILRGQNVLLEQQIDRLVQEKKNEAVNFTTIINEMKKNMEEGEMRQQDLQNQIEQLNFTVNSTKLDSEAYKDQKVKRINELVRINKSLDYKIDDYMAVMMELEGKISTIESQLSISNQALEEESQFGEKKDKIIEQQKQELSMLQIWLEEAKKIKKDLTETVNQIDLRLTDKLQQNQKLKMSLQQQEVKSGELKDFVSKMMRQKEDWIRKQLYSGEQLMQFQNIIMDKSKDIELLTQQNERLIRLNEQLKDINKKLSSEGKQTEGELQDLKATWMKCEQRLRQKQTILQSQENYLKQFESKYKTVLQKHRMDTREIQQQMQKMGSNYSEEVKILKQSNRELEQTLRNKTAEIQKLLKKVQQMQEDKFIQHQKMVNKEQDLQSKKNQIEDLKTKIYELDGNLNEISEELKQKQEKLFQMSGTNYSLELMIKQTIDNQYIEVRELERDLMSRCQTACEEYQYKIDLMVKEKEYVEKQLEDIQKDLTRRKGEINQLEIRETNTKKIFDEKIIKINEEKLLFTSAKNLQIQKATDQNKRISDILNQKEIDSRKIIVELDASRRSITNLEHKIRESEDKQESLKRQFQVQMQMLRKKEIESRNFKEGVNNRQWNMEREVKKMTQNFVRNYLQMCEQKDSNKIVELVRLFECSLLDTIVLKPFSNH